MTVRPEQSYERVSGWSACCLGVVVLAVAILAGCDGQAVGCLGGLAVAAACFGMGWYALVASERWDEMEFTGEALLLRRKGVEKVVPLGEIDGLGDQPDGEGGKTLFLSYGGGKRIGFEASHEGRVFLNLIAEAQ